MTQSIMGDSLSPLGPSPYFQINTGYPDSTGAYPNGGLIYGVSASDQYSKGPSLTIADLQDVVRQQVDAHNLPLDSTAV